MNRLKDLREDKDLKQVDIAKQLGISQRGAHSLRKSFAKKFSGRGLPTPLPLHSLLIAEKCTTLLTGKLKKNGAQLSMVETILSRAPALVGGTMCPG